MTWYTFPTAGMPFVARADFSALLIKKYVYTFGGCNLDEECSADVVGLNIDSQLWFPCDFSYRLKWSPPAMKEHTATVIDDEMYVIGGYSPNLLAPYSNATYVWDPRSLMWSAPDVAGQFVGRAGHTATRVGNDRIFVFGGYNDVSFLSRLDVLQLTLSLDARQRVTLSWQDEVLVTGERPSPRKGHAAVLVGSTIYFYGGFSENARSLSDLYIFDTVNMRWTIPQPPPTGDTPPPLQGHTFLASDKMLYLFGGCTYGGGAAQCSNQLYELDTQHLGWRYIRTWGAVAQPAPREGHFALFLGSRMLVVGGCNPEDRVCYNDSAWVETKPCAAECSYHGRCAAGGCECDTGYYGAVCENIFKECRSNCSNRGVCLPNGTCDCHFPFVEDDCSGQLDDVDGPLQSAEGEDDPVELAKVQHNIEANITAAVAALKANITTKDQDVPRKNILDMRFPPRPFAVDRRLPNGEVVPPPSCPNDCSGHGQCNRGKCACVQDWHYDDCSVATQYAACPNSCVGRGICVYGRCQCFKGFTGPECKIAVIKTLTTDCPGNCNGHGTCYNSRCECVPGYYGADCHSVAFVRCPNDCSGHGQCKAGVCMCNRSWDNPRVNDCSLRTTDSGSWF